VTKKVIHTINKAPTAEKKSGGFLYVVPIGNRDSKDIRSVIRNREITEKQNKDQPNTRRAYTRLGFPSMVKRAPIQGIPNHNPIQNQGIRGFMQLFQELFV
jgi:hypothetical protein